MPVSDAGMIPQDDDGRRMRDHGGFGIRRRPGWFLWHRKNPRRRENATNPAWRDYRLMSCHRGHWRRCRFGVYLHHRHAAHTVTAWPCGSPTALLLSKCDRLNPIGHGDDEKDPPAPRRVRRYSDDPDSAAQEESGSSEYLRTRRGMRFFNDGRCDIHPSWRFGKKRSSGYLAGVAFVLAAMQSRLRSLE